MQRPLPAVSAVCKVFAVALCALLLQACSAVKLAYEQAPTALAWQADNYLDLSSRQEARLKTDMAAFHAWHRTTQLPVYAEFLAKTRPQLLQDLSPAQSCAAWSDAKTQLQPALEQLATVGSWLLADLSASQLAHLEKKLAASNADWREEWLDASTEERKAARYRQTLSRSEFLYGDLNAEQKKAIKALLEKPVFDAQKSYALRLARQGEMLELLRMLSAARAGQERPRITAFLRGLLANDPQTVTPYQAALRDEGCALFADIHNLTTPAQRARAAATVKGYEADLTGLAAKA